MDSPFQDFKLLSKVRVTKQIGPSIEIFFFISKTTNSAAEKLKENPSGKKKYTM